MHREKISVSSIILIFKKVIGINYGCILSRESDMKDYWSLIWIYFF